MVVLLALAAAAALMLSALPAASLLAVPVLAALAWRSAGRERGCELRFGGDGSLKLVDAGGEGCAAELLEVAERGPLLLVVVRMAAPDRRWFAANGRSYRAGDAPDRDGPNGRSCRAGDAAGGTPTGTAAGGDAGGSGSQSGNEACDLPRRSGRWPRTSAPESRRPRARTLRLCFGPDTAPAPQRRALRLWQQRHAGAPDPALAALGLR